MNFCPAFVKRFSDRLQKEHSALMYYRFIHLKPQFMWYIEQSSLKVQYCCLAKKASEGFGCPSHGKRSASQHHRTPAFTAKSAPNLLHISVQSNKKSLNIPSFLRKDELCFWAHLTFVCDFCWTILYIVYYKSGKIRLIQRACTMKYCTRLNY